MYGYVLLYSVSYIDVRPYGYDCTPSCIPLLLVVVVVFCFGGGVFCFILKIRFRGVFAGSEPLEPPPSDLTPF